jgi:hypothetical protein
MMSLHKGWSRRADHNRRSKLHAERDPKSL